MSPMPTRLPILAESPVPTSTEAEELLRVGDLAQRTHKTVRALHLYEELGLLNPSERSKGGYRLYGHEAVVRVRWISTLQEMGFSLPAIRELVQHWERAGSAPDAMGRIHALYAEKLAETERQLLRLQELRDELRAAVAYLETCEVCEPERLISACKRCDLHRCSTPDLVAGLHGPRPQPQST